MPRRYRDIKEYEKEIIKLRRRASHPNSPERNPNLPQNKYTTCQNDTAEGNVSNLGQCRSARDCLGMQSLFVRHPLGKTLVSECGELLNNLDFLCNVRSAVETVEIVLKFRIIVRTVIIRIFNVLEIDSPGLIGL